MIKWTLKKLHEITEWLEAVVKYIENKRFRK